jgi:hypothetical protein
MGFIKNFLFPGVISFFGGAELLYGCSGSYAAFSRLSLPLVGSKMQLIRQFIQFAGFSILDIVKDYF